MRSPSEMSVIQIEVTNRCHLSCANCTRFVSHIKKPFTMSLQQVQDSIRSLKGFKGNIGLMGGEPTTHPEFLDILDIYRHEVKDKSRRQLWTAGHKWEEYKDEIHRTFDVENIAYNDHSKPHAGTHQPLLVAIDEVVEDHELMMKYIDNCWIQNRWSASITPKGAFICEVAAAQAHLYDSNYFMPITEGWYNIKPTDPLFIAQVYEFCSKCSGCLPFIKTFSSHSDVDLISPGNAERLGLDSLSALICDINLCKAYIEDIGAEPGKEVGSLEGFPEWHPWLYREEVFHGPGEGDLTVKEVRKLQGK